MSTRRQRSPRGHDGTAGRRADERFHVISELVEKFEVMHVGLAEFVARVERALRLEGHAGD